MLPPYAILYTYDYYFHFMNLYYSLSIYLTSSYLHHFFYIYTFSLTNKQLWNYEIEGNGVSLYPTYVLILDFFTLSWSSLLLYLQLMFRVKYFLGDLAKYIYFMILDEIFNNLQPIRQSTISITSNKITRLML